jgi:HK97 family phage portal protein
MTAAMEAMQTVGTVFAIVNGNAEATAEAEWGLFRDAASGRSEDREEVTLHAALDLWNRPNPFYTRFSLVEAFQQHEELVGEACWVIAKVGTLPLELWPVRPDRIEPVPHPTRFISGYVYTSPDGEKVPLDTTEVLRITLPNPMDPYRGLGPLQSVMADVDASRYSAEWNRSFFINGAQPGGIIKLDRRVNDVEFNQMRARWDEQHRGVSRAHRVAILEAGEYQQIKYSVKDMQFVELGNANSEAIRRAWRYPKPMLGTVEDVNRANAEAAEVMYARWMIRPRLRRIKELLNTRLLPLYGNTTKGLYFDFVDPVPEDRVAEDNRLTTRVAAAVSLIGAGFDKEDVLLQLDLPAIEVSEEPEPEPEKPPVPPDEEDQQEEAEEELEEEAPPGANGRARAKCGHPRAEKDEGFPEGDLGEVQEVWEKALEKLLKAWNPVVADQHTALLTQIRAAVDKDDILALADVTAPDAGGADVLETAMTEVYEKAAATVAADAAAAGVEIEAATVNEALLRERATVLAKLLARELSISAVRQTMRLNTPNTSGAQVADAVGTFLESLTGASRRDQLGAALTGAQNNGRLDTMRQDPTAAYYGDEQLDSNTCKECRKVDGKWLGNTADEAEFLYPNGGYRDCEGGSRCRGTVVVVWRGGDDASLWKEKEPA